VYVLRALRQDWFWSTWIARRPIILIAFEDLEKYALFSTFLDNVSMSGTRVLVVATREEPARSRKTESFLWEIQG
jgi:hypothetical protein